MKPQHLQTKYDGKWIPTNSNEIPTHQFPTEIQRTPNIPTIAKRYIRQYFDFPTISLNSNGRLRARIFQRNSNGYFSWKR